MESKQRFPQSLEIASRFPHSAQADGNYVISKAGKIIVAEREKYLTPNTPNVLRFPKSAIPSFRKAKGINCAAARAAELPAARNLAS